MWWKHEAIPYNLQDLCQGHTHCDTEVKLSDLPCANKIQDWNTILDIALGGNQQSSLDEYTVDGFLKEYADW